MKKFSTLFLFVLLFTASMAQTPEGFKYQAVLRDATGNVKVSTNVTLVIDLLQNSITGTSVYAETHAVQTNAFGLVNLTIGEGTLPTATFTAIDWANGPYFIKITVDGTEMGTSQLMSVPYAMHAKTAESITGSITETDPVFANSQAVNISASDIAKLSNLSGTNTGDQDLSGLATTTALNNKVDKDGTKVLSTNDYSDAEKTKVSNLSGTNTGDQDLTGLAHTNRVAIDAVTGINTGDQDLSGYVTTADATSALDLKVDKDGTKVLSTNDYSDAEKTKVSNLSGTNTGDNAVNSLYSGLVNYTHPTGDGNLHVPATGTTNSGKVLTAGATAGSLSWSALTSSQWTTAGSDIYYNTGNVGIGTTTPTYQLDLGNGTSVADRIRLQRGSDDVNQNMLLGWNNITVQRLNSTLSNGQTDFSIIQSGSDGSRTPFYIDYIGNVGIGTTTPSSKLHIAGADMNNALLFENTSANPGRNYILFKTQGTEQGYIGLGGGATNHMSVAAYGASNNLFLETNDLVRMTVLPSGNIGIGTTTPAYKLDVAGDVNVTGNFKVNGVNISTGSSSTHYLGEEYLGGIIFYLYTDATGTQKGLIVSKTESTATWSGSTLVGANKSSDGAYNMALMPTGVGTARTWVETLGAGWYLPSIDELGILYHNRFHVNNSTASGLTLLATEAYYWSSTEYIASHAFLFYFTYAYTDFITKTSTNRVRAVRAF